MRIQRKVEVRAGGKPWPPVEAYRRIRMVVMDVDGVLTDGRIALDGRGVEAKFYDVRDGAGLTLLRYAGLKLALLSGRASPVIRQRARDLHVPARNIREGQYRKLPAYFELLALNRVQPAETAYVGDDLIDLPILERCGIACCPGDARPEVIAACHVVALARGGRGAMRLIAEHLLKRRHDGTWLRALHRYLGNETVSP